VREMVEKNAVVDICAQALLNALDVMAKAKSYQLI
jgi:hypothetical protein